jgi:hypothetical protein
MGRGEKVVDRGVTHRRDADPLARFDQRVMMCEPL